jgi:hypothetical protein
VVGEGIGLADSVRDGAGADLGCCVEALTVTLLLILLMVDVLTPARFKSATDVNGRPAMIFFAVAGPMPGSASSCS